MYFAAVYDTFMEEVPREKWAAFIKEKLNNANINDGIILDLGCGTGAMTRIFADFGYDMIGVDGSAEMLNEAREEENRIMYLCQDFTELELYGTVAAVFSCCDCMNYITDKDDLCKVFKLVNNYLEKKGLFIFDINTEYKYKEILADNVFAEDALCSAFIWQNSYDEETKINNYGLTLFISDEYDESAYEDTAYYRCYEEHCQKAYSLDEIKELLEKAGMEFVGAFVDYTDLEINDSTASDERVKTAERITIIAREGFQEGKYYE